MSYKQRMHDQAMVAMTAPTPSDEVEAMIAELDQLCSCETHPRFPDAKCLNCRVVAMLRSLSKDAERYRQVRAEACVTMNYTPAEFDARYDAALAAKEPM